MSRIPPRQISKMKKDDWNALYFEANQIFTPSLPIRTAELFAGRADGQGVAGQGSFLTMQRAYWGRVI